MKNYEVAYTYGENGYCKRFQADYMNYVCNGAMIEFYLKDKLIFTFSVHKLSYIKILPD